MSHDADIHLVAIVVDEVNNSVIPNPNSPKIARACKLHAARRSWIRCQRAGLGKNPVCDGFWKLLNLLKRTWFN
jgi:hypothetical protein